MRVYQLGYGVIPGDAVTTHMLEIDRRLQQWGFETFIFAQHVAPEMRHLAAPDVELSRLLNQTGDLLLYHYSIYTPNVRLFRSFRGPKILIYHNITPAHFFRRWDRRQAWLCRIGRWVLPLLKDCDLGLGVSEYNRGELVQAGFPAERTGVLSIFLPVDEWENAPINPSLQQYYRKNEHTNFLSVGRIVPNKAIDEVIRVFYVYHRYINPHSRLFLVGSRYIPTYDAQINTLLRTLGLEKVVSMPGLVSVSDLKTYYHIADIYLNASYHEGFCVPLLESMYFGVPIIARYAAAIPETLGDAGVLFTRLGYIEVAEMSHLLVTDANLRARIIQTQYQRLQAFAPERIEMQLKFALRQVGVL